MKLKYCISLVPVLRIDSSDVESGRLDLDLEDLREARTVVGLIASLASAARTALLLITCLFLFVIILEFGPGNSWDFLEEPCHGEIIFRCGSYLASITDFFFLSILRSFCPSH